MTTTTTTFTRPAPEETVRLRAANPPAQSSFDGLTERLRPVNLPLIGKVTDTMRQRYLDLDTITGPPSAWSLARMALVLLLASMPILAIPVEVFGVAPQNLTSIAVIVLTAVLATLVVFVPHRTDVIIGRGLIAGMVACIVYDAARLFAVHVLGLMAAMPAVSVWRSSSSRSRWVSTGGRTITRCWRVSPSPCSPPGRV